MRTLILTGLLVGCRGDKASGSDDSDAAIALTRVFSSLSFSQPVLMVQPPGDDSRWLVVQQSGEIYSFEAESDVSEATLFLDLSDTVASGFERGLLGLAFHPDFASTGSIYLSYTTRSGGGKVSRVSRVTSADGAISADPDSEVVLLEVAQPYDNHNGGHVAFGPDGTLYLGLGDGGSAGDPAGNGQDTSTLLGAMLRLDVDGGDPYAIPADNPFADGGGAPEIFAWGLRNPWRWSFDRATGALWVGDVGQNSWEEVDHVELGGNYGWNTKEAFSCYRAETCDEAGLIDPVVAYENDGEDASVIVGPVYRGEALPTLQGVLLYTDFYYGTIWGLTYDPITAEPDPTVLLDETGLFVSSFAEDAAGEVYAVDYLGGGLYRVDAAEAPREDDFPTRLSETGCVDPDDPSAPSSGAIPYGVRAPLWSDGAEKDRWFAIPDDETLDIDADGRLQLPPGSVAVKTFRRDDRPVETRLFVHHDDGGWAGYTYAWDEDGVDAELVRGGGRRTFGEREWAYPSGAQCLQCHTEVSGRVLGLELAQLAGEFTYPSGKTADQLATLEHIGLFTEALPEVTALPSPTDTAEGTTERARALLHANCAPCHQPGALGAGDHDLRYSTPFAETGLCDVEPQNGDLGVDGAVLVAPGAPERSVLALRMAALDANRMPSVGSEAVDEAGLAVVEAWILALESCSE